ncbi:hypothetical protein [Chlamydia phage phiCPAR39]|uniref:Uncharacterized protein n=1 Tax=Chlamydia phage phiCPAR39 TaxID=2932877 RepID=Q9MBM4_9VIRU|nr:hypothetical protein phiCPAR39p6 [Chlamydia phage phiCPAR39]AAF39723.1 hypothetical protein [Chlamydia phage phiCPAR39]
MDASLMQFLKKVFDFYVAEVCIFFVPFLTSF